jgi:site-specific DNA recombinase
MGSVAHSSSDDKTPKAGKLRAVIYDRVSTTLQVRQGYSHGESGFQVAECRKLADEIGATVTEVVEESGESGAKWDLPGLNRVLDLAKRGAFDVLLCHDPDRLARNLAKQLVVEEQLRKHRVAIRYVTMQTGDTAEDRLTRNVRGAVAEYEREKTAFRSDLGRRQKAKNGTYVGTGEPPYGYRYRRQIDPTTKKNRVVGIEPDPDTAPVVQRIYRDAHRFSLAQIAASLAADGISPPRGARVWHGLVLLRILRKPIYRGEALYGRYDTNGRMNDPSTWISIPVCPLVDEPTWYAVQEALTERKERRRRRIPADADPYLLRERLTCGYCGGAISTAISHGIRYYQCLRHHTWRQLGVERCPMPDVLQHQMDEYAWQCAGAALLDAEALARGMEVARAEYDEAAARWHERIAALDRQIDNHRRMLRSLIRDRAAVPHGGETYRALSSVIDETEATIARLNAERANLAPTSLPGLSAEQAESLEEFAATAREGLTTTILTERRRIVEILNLRGTIREDREHGLHIGRQRIHVDWRAIIPIRGKGTELLSSLMPESERSITETAPDLSIWR